MATRKALLNYTFPELIEKIKQGLKQKPSDFFSRTPNSVLFWNGLFYLALIIITIYSFQAGACISLITSVFYLALTLDETDLDDHLWIYSTALFWLCILLFAFVSLFYYTIVKPITRFNEWLNKPKPQQNH